MIVYLFMRVYTYAYIMSKHEFIANYTKLFSKHTGADASCDEEISFSYCLLINQNKPAH